MSDVATSPFSEGLARYKKARANCAKDTTALNSADSDTAKQHAKCGKDKTAAVEASKLAAQQQKQVQDAWDTTVAAYNKGYVHMYTAYQNTANQVRKDDADRTAEWRAAQTIKCLLINYKATGKIDEAAEEKCNEAIVTKGVVDIGYPKVIQQIAPHLKPFEAQADDSAYENTCNKRTPSPAFSCTAPARRPIPTCNTHKQAAAPAHEHHKGPWNGEVEAKSWSLAQGVDAPGKEAPQYASAAHRAAAPVLKATYAFSNGSTFTVNDGLILAF